MEQNSDNKIYDIIIIGGGPAGITAAIYAKRYNLKVLLIAKEFGGYVNEAPEVDNYPGFKQISGIRLVDEFKKHLDYLKVEILNDNVVNVKKCENGFFVQTSDNKNFTAKTLVVAMGTERRKLNVPGEDKFLGRGVSYCATCDGAFFKNKIVAVVGGGDSAAKAAMILSEHASKVYIFVRGSSMIAEPANQEILKANKKIEILFNTSIKEICGEKIVSCVELNGGRKIDLQGIFVEIGSVPSISILKELNLETDKSGYVAVDKGMRTNVPGVFAAGDIVNEELKQIITACGQGATAAHSAYNFLKKNA